jgi:hypothetical protein
MIHTLLLVSSYLGVFLPGLALLVWLMHQLSE